MMKTRKEKLEATKNKIAKQYTVWVELTKATATSNIQKFKNKLEGFGYWCVAIGLLLGFLVFGFQIYWWLKYGSWLPISVGMGILFILELFSPETAGNFTLFLQNWAGIEKIFNFIPFSFFLPFLGYLIFMIIVKLVDEKAD